MIDSGHREQAMRLLALANDVRSRPGHPDLRAIPLAEAQVLATMALAEVLLSQGGPACSTSTGSFGTATRPGSAGSLSTGGEAATPADGTATSGSGTPMGRPTGYMLVRYSGSDQSVVIHRHSGRVQGIYDLLVNGVNVAVTLTKFDGSEVSYEIARQYQAPEPPPGQPAP